MPNTVVDRLRFAGLLIRLRSLAQRAGMPALVEALRRCVDEVREGELDCPLAVAILEFHARRSRRAHPGSSVRALEASIETFVAGGGHHVRAAVLREAILACEAGPAAGCPLRRLQPSRGGGG